MEEKPNIDEQIQAPEETTVPETETPPKENKKRSPEIKRWASAMMASAVLGLGFFDAEKLAAEPKELKLPPTTEKTLTPEEVRIAQLRREIGAPQKIERILTPAEKRTEHLKYMHERALNDDAENYSISITKEDAYFVETESGGEERFVLIPSEDIGEIAKDKKSTVELMHTHPLKAIKEITGEQKEAGPYVMPPSMLDLISHIRNLKMFKMKPSQFKDMVVDPTGTWEMSADKNSSFYEKISDAIDASQELFLEDFGISNEEEDLLVKLIKEGADELAKARNIAEGLDLIAAKDPQHSQLLKKAKVALTEIIAKQTTEVIRASAEAAEVWPDQEREPNDFDTTIKTSWKDLQEYENKRPSGQSTKEEIKEFIDFWGARGLKLKHTEFENSEKDATK